VLLVSLAMLGIDYLIMALAPNLWVLFVGRVLAGIAGATYSTATAYIADVTPRQDRSAAFGLVGAAFGVGFILGPAIGGVMGELGTRAPFYAAAALAFLNFAYGWVAVPESLAPANRRSFEWRRANPFGAVRQVARVPMIAWFVLAHFLFGLSHHVYPAVWSYYTKAAFAWSNAQIGVSLALVGVGFAVVQGGLIRVILRRLGEVRTAVAGFAVNVVAMLALAFATQGWMVYAMIPVTALGAIVTPALAGLMANRTPDNAQGELQGVLASSQAIVSVISPLFMTQLFGAFTTAGAPVFFPGAPFLAAAVLMALVVLPFARGLRQTDEA
jgi:DHA1 family tetracycline resistance protein-like MFS transporter